MKSNEPVWILDDGQPAALWVAAGYQPSQTTHFTQPDMDQQLGVLVHLRGTSVPRHKHETEPRLLTGSPELLILRKGSCRVTLYNRKDEPMSEFMMRTGDILLILSGGHAFEMLDDCEWIQTRAGSFPGNEAKKLF
jgi:apolipoprotein N-acyltransferase